MALLPGRTREWTRPRGTTIRTVTGTRPDLEAAYTRRASNCPGQSFSPTVKASVRVKPLAS